MTIVSTNIHTDKETKVTYRIYSDAGPRPWVAICIGRDESDGTIFIEDPAILKHLTEICLEAMNELAEAIAAK